MPTLQNSTEFSSLSLVKVTSRLTVSQSVSQSVSLGVEPHLGLMTRYLLLFDSYRLVLWGTLSNERAGLSFVYAADPCQRTLSRVRVPWDSRPYFTVSDLRLPFPSSPTTRRVTVELFDPASTRVSLSLRTIKIKVRIKITSRLTVSQSVSLGVESHLRLLSRYLFRFDSYGLISWGAPSDRSTGLSFVYAAGPCQRSLSRFWVPWDSRLYFTVSDLRFPFSSPPTRYSTPPRR
jgi:hypothetical protein